MMEKLLPRSRPLLPRDVEPLLVEEKRESSGGGQDNSFTKAQRPFNKSTMAENTVEQKQTETAAGKVGDPVNETLQGSAGEYMTSASASSAPDTPATGERLFVFRDPPEACDCVDVPKRKRKRNFLNLKKGSVAPTNLS